MLTPQDEALLLLSQWEREAKDNVRMKLAALQLGELFQEEIPCRALKSTLRMPVSTTRRQCWPLRPKHWPSTSSKSFAGQSLPDKSRHTGKHVWVAGCYAMKHHPDIRQVGDSRDNAFDEDGNCILSVPADWCWFMDETEAECITHCIDADQRLLAYAYG